MDKTRLDYQTELTTRIQLGLQTGKRLRLMAMERKDCPVQYGLFKSTSWTRTERIAKG